MNSQNIKSRDWDVQFLKDRLNKRSIQTLGIRRRLKHLFC